MNITGMNILEATVAYFQANYEINESNALEASEKIAKAFLANYSTMVQAVTERQEA